MKKILEVLRYGDGDIRFNTDVDPVKQPKEVADLLSQIVMTMATKLWGGNELAVLAVIRLLAVADLSLCVNRKEMIRNLDSESAQMANAFREAISAFKEDGGKAFVFSPGIKPPKMRN